MKRRSSGGPDVLLSTGQSMDSFLAHRRGSLPVEILATSFSGDVRDQLLQIRIVRAYTAEPNGARPPSALRGIYGVFCTVRYSRHRPAPVIGTAVFLNLIAPPVSTSSFSPNNPETWVIPIKCHPHSLIRIAIGNF